MYGGADTNTAIGDTAIGLIADGTIDPAPMISAVCALDDAAAAYEQAAHALGHCFGEQFY